MAGIQLWRWCVVLMVVSMLVAEGAWERNTSNREMQHAPFGEIKLVTDKRVLRNISRNLNRGIGGWGRNRAVATPMPRPEAKRIRFVAGRFKPRLAQNLVAHYFPRFWRFTNCTCAK